MDADTMASAAAAEQAEQMWRRNTYTTSSPRLMRSLWRSQPSEAAASYMPLLLFFFFFCFKDLIPLT
jgi:hypothetical protein